LLLSTAIGNFTEQALGIFRIPELVTRNAKFIAGPKIGTVDLKGLQQDPAGGGKVS